MEPFPFSPMNDPARAGDVRLSETRGWSEREVELKFGEPARRGREPLPGPVGGAMMDVWEYRTARGERWLLYFEEGIVDVGPLAPTDAIGKLLEPLAGSAPPPALQKRVVKVWYFEAEARR